ncbi:MAG: tetratricopeptide repeat protein [Gammaproteobacteria bacterium]|nr:tetratricopeptide repeat protein [Gammaproteobacteria bacterium]
MTGIEPHLRVSSEGFTRHWLSRKLQIMRISTPLALLLTMALFLPLVSVEADQNDVRLNGLFDALVQTDDTSMLSEVESRIWTIWHEHPNQNVQSLMVTGIEYMNRQYTAEAMVIFNKIIQQYPDYAEAWNKRATLHYLLGNLQASISDIDKTLALEPRHFGALSGLGLVYIQQENLPKAREAFENLLKVHPNSSGAKANLKMVNEAFRLNFI